MKKISERIAEVAAHLQTLATPEFSTKIQTAVETGDRNSIAGVCKKAKIPETYIGTITSVILSVNPQKWPPEY